MVFNRYVQRINTKLLEKYSERRDTLLGLHFDNILHLSYRQIKETIPSLLEQGKVQECILLVLRSKSKKLPRWRLWFVSHSAKLKFWFWVQDQYKLLGALEQKWLSSPPDPKLSAAGIAEMDILGDKVMIDELAGGQVWMWATVKDTPYEDIFDKQLKTVLWAKVTKRLNKLN